MNVKMPNFDYSTLSLINSILKSYGVNVEYKTLDNLDNELSKKYKNVILFLFDGLGNINLEMSDKDGYFCKNKFDVISSVFPATTVAAINTISSGLPPITNGWLGWTMYFKEIDDIVVLFRNQYAFRNEEVTFDYKSLIAYKNIFERINEVSDTNCLYVSPSSIKPTMNGAKNIKYKINPYKYHSWELNKGLKLLVKELNASTKPTFTYFYNPFPDALMHEIGVDNKQVKKVILNIEKNIEKVIKKLPKDTLVIVTADHGLTNINKSIFLEEDNELFNMMEKRTSIEGRAATFFIKKEYLEEFPKVFLEKYGDDFILKTKEEVLNEHIFGPGEIHQNVYSSLGDFLAIAKSDAILYSITKKDCQYPFVGAHAGITEMETTVPLIMIKK